MAQSAVTVRIDSKVKSQFDELCEQFGMSANTAQSNALDLFMQQRSAAEASQEPEMTLDEINAEIRAARVERRI
ncbi:hypothetical protein L6475_13505 [Prevotella sp. E9-3]|uniref:hypothetical protein n=1 Tax=Prevotella sp. E9-3 TaxID=2913621 RepID=UPI001EDAC7A7|nr:hypothetical protein [Prevotella sp. E9-3]UKK48204.1 hypothetical protein L6475_13505 [Prevotella sp. E9-3]